MDPRVQKLRAKPVVEKQVLQVNVVARIRWGAFMKQFFALSIRTQLVLITLIIALPAVAIIVQSGIKRRMNVVEDTYDLTKLVAERIASEQGNMAAAVEQLLVTLAQLPEVRRHDKVRVQQLINKINALNRACK